MADEHVQSQHESKLLSMPVEVRQEIYAHIFHGQIHVFLSQGRIYLSGCVQPNLGDDCHDGRVRKTMDISKWKSPDPTFARRLRSSWGPHRECEEAAYVKNISLQEHYCYHTHDLLYVCKKI